MLKSLLKKIKKSEGMSNWPDRLKIYATLSTTKSLLQNVSQNEGFGLESPEESIKIIDQAISYFHNPDANSYPTELESHFGPTGPIQEISLSNGWGEVFLKLAEQFDHNVHCIKK